MGTKTDQEREAFLRASSQARQRIASAAREAEEPVRQLLSMLEKRLYNDDLDAGTLYRDCGLQPSAASVLFRETAGMTLKPFIQELRLSTAMQLLETSDLPVFRVAELVGYRNFSVFRRAFQKWSGSSPTEHRAARAPSEPKDAQPKDSQPSADRLLHLTTCGTATRAQAEAVAQALVEAWRRETRAKGELEGDSPSSEPVGDDVLALERVEARLLWEALEDRPAAEQRLILQRYYRFQTPEFFHLLCRESQRRGRRNSHQALDLANLALWTVRLVCSGGSAQRGRLEARGWATVAEASRLALDLPSAELALGNAFSSLAGQDGSSALNAELLRLKAALRWYQRRLPEARALVNEALSLCTAAGDQQPYVQVLALRGQIQTDAGNFDAGLADLDRALHLAMQADDPLPCLSLLRIQAANRALAGDYRAANQLAQRALSEDGIPDLDSERGQLVWVLGFAAWGEGDLQKARSLMAQARDELYSAEQLGDAAIATLHLSCIALQASDKDGAYSIAQRALPLLRDLGRDGESSGSEQAVAAGRALKEALATRRLCPDTIEPIIATIPPVTLAIASPAN